MNADRRDKWRKRVVNSAQSIAKCVPRLPGRRIMQLHCVGAALRGVYSLEGDSVSTEAVDKIVKKTVCRTYDVNIPATVTCNACECLYLLHEPLPNQVSTIQSNAPQSHGNGPVSGPICIQLRYAFNLIRLGRT
jgi:hypothetical protein